jgi:hypothetical protein
LLKTIDAEVGGAEVIYEIPFVSKLKFAKFGNELLVILLTGEFISTLFFSDRG